MVLLGATFNAVVAVCVVSLLLFRLPMAMLWQEGLSLFQLDKDIFYQRSFWTTPHSNLFSYGKFFIFLQTILYEWGYALFIHTHLLCNETLIFFYQKYCFRWKRIYLWHISWTIHNWCSVWYLSRKKISSCYVKSDYEWKEHR